MSAILANLAHSIRTETSWWLAGAVVVVILTLLAWATGVSDE